MYAQIFFVTSLRGSGSVPTILDRCSEGCMGFIKALFVLGAVFAFAIFHSPSSGKRAQLRDHRNCNGSGSADVHKRNDFGLVSGYPAIQRPGRAKAPASDAAFAVTESATASCFGQHVSCGCIASSGRLL